MGSPRLLRGLEGEGDLRRRIPAEVAEACRLPVHGLDELWDGMARGARPCKGPVGDVLAEGAVEGAPAKEDREVLPPRPMRPSARPLGADPVGDAVRWQWIVVPIHDGAAGPREIFHAVGCADADSAEARRAWSWPTASEASVAPDAIARSLNGELEVGARLTVRFKRARESSAFDKAGATDPQRGGDELPARAADLACSRRRPSRSPL